MLNGIPELGPVVCPLGRICRGHDFAVVDAALLAVVEHQAGALIGDGFTSTISRRPGRTASGGSANWLGREVIDRHDAAF
jgi:hypothetical protein